MNKILTLKRLLPRLPDRTFGILFDDDSYPICLSVERPWKNNTPEISCIPLGEYTIRRKVSNEFKIELFEILNVNGRTNVEIHRGNFFEDSKGCVILGSSFGWIVNKSGAMEYGIRDSKTAFAAFMDRMVGIDEAKLVIVEV